MQKNYSACYPDCVFAGMLTLDCSMVLENDHLVVAGLLHASLILSYVTSFLLPLADPEEIQNMKYERRLKAI